MALMIMVTGMRYGDYMALMIMVTGMRYGDYMALMIMATGMRCEYYMTFMIMVTGMRYGDYMALMIMATGMRCEYYMTFMIMVTGTRYEEYLVQYRFVSNLMTVTTSSIVTAVNVDLFPMVIYHQEQLDCSPFHGKLSTCFHIYLSRYVTAVLWVSLIWSWVLITYARRLLISSMIWLILEWLVSAWTLANTCGQVTWKLSTTGWTISTSGGFLPTPDHSSSMR